MMRLWMTSYAQPASRTTAGLLSVVVHTVVISAWVAGTRPEASLPRESLANRVYYMPPPDKPPMPRMPRSSGETIRYVTFTQGIGAGPGPTAIDARQSIAMTEHSATSGETKTDSVPVATPPVTGEKNADSVFTLLEVDSAVVRSQSSAAPAYPLELLEKHIEGSVVTRYIVDTTGFADPASLEVLRSTHPEFVRAVEDALPYMRFSPAKIGTLKVRQLVEQSFTFRILLPTPPDTGSGIKPPER